jgi:hypothetical protein
VNKIIFLFLVLILTTECSLNKNSKFWTSSKNIDEDINLTKTKIIFNESVVEKEFNPNLKIRFVSSITKNNLNGSFYNNLGRLNFDKSLNKSSRFKFSKIKNFYQFEPEISPYNDNIIFFDNQGSILRFDSKSNLVWKKNYYTKSEKKLKPILQFSNNGKYLVVADNITKYYILDIETGELLWIKSNLAPFNSQIKIQRQIFHS